ncbi:acyl-CoA dehydrogenase family protein [Ancylobacter sp. TS-1]|uniref:acyl-CoA dehydrogenase family protein n=1 Tax=Ancylobacter sp. TS-1 TaxID=1850374 RepID=UPI001265C62D|nr:acyl-CoA dehydrogenase family protein [Ancylobacter sp. TS-1]QFR31913.1 hypothetical protein GBB76_01595 [Ancylobacter sp. TS-1]
MLDTGPGERRLIDAAFRDEMRHVAARAAALDEDGCFPSQDIAGLAAAGALAAPFRAGDPVVDAEQLPEALRRIGHASLPLGRLFEGHVNAAMLIRRFGTPGQWERAGREARAGALFGIWNTEGADGVRLVRRGGGLRLHGGKTFASGAGHVDRPLITARCEEGGIVLVLARPDAAPRADLSGWKAHGMRASATGSFDFTDLAVEPEDIVGGPGDYHRQPFFSAGAWRFCAVQLGGIERLVDEARLFLRGRGRHEDPHQLARMGEAATAAETARLWVERAARIAEAEDVAASPDAAAAAIAYVNLARGAVEHSGLEVMQLVQRSIGLAAFLRDHPVERLCRDLATYLRQPAPDRALCEGAAHILRSTQPLGEIWR